MAGARFGEESLQSLSTDALSLEGDLPTTSCKDLILDLPWFVWRRDVVMKLGMRLKIPYNAKTSANESYPHKVK